ncbi:S-adenosyl-L-methionine-dependent methyltransferases superfamily protein [Actinidia rufa]|uniref:S-adenosyl-L-methionine-dependent methyltransferases superfamily protein n=1 Tax=Actinidia rufa TaxID=165716 RepID=A0A7J0ELX9_9ERIC|nr:S-adenosyl-L-methionine-dependent methyltransferases superfamily protein [Actinidia rufa]
MALWFLSAPSSASIIITCHATPSAVRAPPAPPPPPLLSLPPNPKPTPLPSLTCALQCPHFQSCSGCTQEYNLQRPIILNEATDFFKKHGVSDFTFDSCKLWGWRCRAKLAVRGSSTDPLVGLYHQEGTHNVADIPDCKGITELNIEPYDEDQGTGELRYVQMAVTTHNTSLPSAERYKNGKVQVSLVWNSRNEKSPSSEKLNALADAFDSLLRKLQKHVHVGASVADLYAGAGVIGLSLAVTRKCRQSVKCVEINKESKPSFEKTAERLPNSVDSSISWHNADTSIEPLSWLVGSDVVVVDPPRKGLDPSLLNALRTIPAVESKAKSPGSSLLKAKGEKRPWIVRSREALVQIESKTTQEDSQSLPQTLIYISCGWESFKEDCKSLLSSNVWHLNKAHGFNFFPGTQRGMGVGKVPFGYQALSAYGCGGFGS